MHTTGSADMENPYHEYLIILNRGELTIPSPNLVNYLFDPFAVLSATKYVLINQSKLTSRNTAEEALSDIMGCCNFTCEIHKIDRQKVVINTIANAFFNDKRTIPISLVRNDYIALFKKQKETIYY